MKNKWIAIIGIASAGALSAHATLIISWPGASKSANLGYGTATVAVSNITGSSATKATDGFGFAAVANTGFNGTGGLSVSFAAADTFAFSAWTSVAKTFSSNSGSPGLGVSSSADNTNGKKYGLNGSEVIVFTIDTSSLNIGANDTLQFRVGAVNGNLKLYEQTATSGALLQSLVAVGTSSEWYDVDRNGSLQTFAIQDYGGNGSDFGSLEFQVIPEPATLGMVAACGAGILFIRRRIMM